MTCSGVNLPGAPGRGASVRIASMARRRSALVSRHSQVDEGGPSLGPATSPPSDLASSQTQLLARSSSLRRPSKARRMMAARWRRCEGAVTASRSVTRMSRCRSVMVTLAALPGMARALLVSGNLVKPGNSRVTVNFMGSQLRLAGLGGSPRRPAESSSLALRTNRSPPVALHPASRRRSDLQLRDARASRQGLSPC